MAGLGEEPPQQPKKTTVNLFVDTNIIQQLRKEAAQMETSLNSRINAILKKYFDFYKRTEEVGDTCVITKKYFQFVVDTIDEEKHIAELTKTFLVWIPALFNDLNVPFTLENFIKYVCENYGLRGRTVDNFTYYIDESGKHCLSHTHRFGIKWSRVLGTSLSTVIAELLKYHTECVFFPGSFVVKVSVRHRK